MARILLADSQPLFTEALKALSSRDALHEVVGLATVAGEALVTVHRFHPELALLSHGWDNSRIGNQLFINQHTVRTHIQNALQKLGMHSKLEAATFAMQCSPEPAPGGAIKLS
jgi:DNA-binding NarL/FixJ family response regulator